jgi:hypothetical protein
MPTVSRQSPPRPAPAAPQFPVGSLLGTAVPVSSLREDKVTLGLYGRNRAGKTTLAAMFPKPLLIVSCEPAHCGAVQSVSDVERVSLIHVEPSRAIPKLGEMWGRDRLEAVGKELVGNTYFRTVVLKTATSLQDLILDEMRVEIPSLPMSGGKAVKETYQMRASRLHDTLRAYLDLKRYMHVVVISQEKDHNPSQDDKGFPDLKSRLLQTMQQGSFIAPALGSGNAQWLYDNCGYMVQIYEDEVTQETVIPMNNPDGSPAPPVSTRIGTGVRQRHLRLKYHPNFAAGGKWQYNKDMPEFVTAPDPQGLYAELVRYIPALRP